MCIHPGIINTNIVRTPSSTGASISDEQLERLQNYYIRKGCTPDVVAADIVQAVVKQKGRVYSGPLAMTTAGLKRLISSSRFIKILINNARAIGYLPAR